LRFLLVDRILELESGKRATGIKNVTLSENFMAYHFPDMPIMPGMLIVEALVQLADWIVREDTGFTQMGLPIAFDRVKFRRIVHPGDQLRLEAVILTRDEQQAEIRAMAYCEGNLVTSADFTLAIQPLEPMLTAEEASRLFNIIHLQPEKKGWPV
jgi:3-hydroxymyristoyl/3-hydroxydecanoyl-(acyl carrier protein) dehydratase